MALPHLKTSISPVRNIKEKSTKSQESLTKSHKTNNFSKPIQNYFVISPLAPKKLKYGIRTKKPSEIRNPITIIDVYNKERILNEFKDETMISRYFKSLKPRMLNFISPIVLRSSKIHIVPHSSMINSSISSESFNKAHKVKSSFDAKKRSIISKTPELVKRVSIDSSYESLDTSTLLNYEIL
ncbi:hypothetical protein SteCoe_15743 [Stentor coeruleus]|uniref:Uncharacterized protein n=1 Tax=Stentor coeruleus TaxID=5963 RepID=A0A1R2C2S7_9CILI|nr:hypothetical protein SteCoe_15743 [Stentor coeruleus]